MPKATEKSSKILYPPGCKEINEELNKDELLKRLKMLARAFQDMGQDEENKYSQLALYLASEFFLDHASRDVKLLVACCIADVFRIFAPEAPYTEPAQLKEIFLFITQQLRGLDDPDSPSFKRYFYLLENLAWVKSFNICIELDDNQEIFCKLYTLIFSIVNEKHSAKVLNFMLDMISPLITEADAVSPELLDIILINIVEPYKSQNRLAYNLARDLIKRTANALEPSVQTFFNNALMLGKNTESEVSGRLFELIYELNMIAPSVLLAVLPQLEFKLKSNDEGERKAVTKLLSKMFSDPDSDLASQNKPLWLCFLGRFNDIEVSVRRTCVQSASDFITNHPDLVKDVADPLKQRQHDPDENVRMDVVQAIVGAAKKDFSVITEDLLECVKERTLDKKFKIRKEALIGLGHIYRKCWMREDPDPKDKEKVAWIRNKVLHAYYQSALDDRILVERILNTSLVPYNLEPSDRMRRLFYLYGNVDPHAVKALNEIFKTQLSLRLVLRNLLELHQKDPSDEIEQLMKNRVIQLARNLPEPTKATEYMKKFNKTIKEDTRIRSYLIKLVSPDCTCKRAEECVKEVLKKMGNPIPQNHLYGNVKQILERVAPVLIDSVAIKEFMKLVEEAVQGVGDIVDDIPNPAETGMKLMLMLSYVFPGSFQSDDVFGQLMSLIKLDDDVVSDLTMQVLVHIGQKLEQNFPNIYSSLLPVLQKMVKFGTPKQAKHAIACIDTLCKKDKEKIYSTIFEHLQKDMDLESPNFLTSLVAIGHIAQLCPGEFATPVKGLVSKFIVKELLMQDRGSYRKTTESWYSDHLVSEETVSKIQAMKMMVRWLLGAKNQPFATNTGNSTLRLLHTFIIHEGDLMETGKINKAEMARLRLSAGACMLKLAHEPCYAELISLDQFQALSLLLNDPCYQVRHNFAQKLNKGLQSLRLPLQYMSIFSLAANDPLKERRQQVKQFLVANITKRRDYLKRHSGANAKLFSLLPEYVMPFTIHLLAHDPDLQDNSDIETLKNIRECLWFIMEPLIKTNDNYSYSFYRKMIENIKQTKDVQGPDNQEMNYKLYAVCDLALGLVMTKTANFVLRDFPAEPALPSKLFTQPDQNCTNTQNYLPKELVITASKAVQRKPGTTGHNAASARKSDDKKNTDISDESQSEASSAPSSPARPQGGSRKSARSRSPAETSSEEEEEESPPAKTSRRGISAKEDRPPVRNARSKDSTGRGKGQQPKITEMVSRQALASKNNKDSSVKKTNTRNTRGGAAEKEAEKTRKRTASSDVEPSPTNKKQRTARQRAASPEESDSDDSSARPSPKKTTGRSKRLQGRRKADSNEAPTTSPSNKSSSPPTPKKKAGTSSDSKKSYPMRRNVRKTVMNGTSDGEDNTPESGMSSPGATPTKRRGTTSGKGSQAKQEETLNVRRKSKRSTRR